MAIIRKCKLSWAASDAEHVIGYKLYWASGMTVDYNSNWLDVGKDTEVTIPDQVCLSDGPVMFGITVIDGAGNESDMTTIAEPFQLQVPEAPPNMRLEPIDEFIITESPEKEVIEPEVIQRLIAQLEENETPVLLDARNASAQQEADDASVRFDIGSIF